MMNPLGRIVVVAGRGRSEFCRAPRIEEGFRPALAGRSGVQEMTMLKISARAGSFAALALAAALVASPAASRDRLSPGAIAAAQGPVYAAPAPVYVEREPVYVAPPPPVLVERCFIERSSEYVPGWGWQRVRRRVCD
jgi:hypothetical protein